MNAYVSPELKVRIQGYLQEHHTLKLIFDDLCEPDQKANGTAQKFNEDTENSYEWKLDVSIVSRVDKKILAEKKRDDEAKGNENTTEVEKIPSSRRPGNGGVRSLFTRLRDKLLDFSHTPNGMSFAVTVQLEEQRSNKTRYRLSVEHKSYDQLFWGQMFLRSSKDRRTPEQVRIVFNEMLCFRDYKDNLLIRSTDMNKAHRELDEDEHRQFEAERSSLLCSLGLNPGEYITSTQYLLAGEIAARDQIRNWFQRSCDSIIVEDQKASHSLNEEEINHHHLVLLGNPRTNYLIEMIQEQNVDYRYRMLKDEMRLLIAEVEQEEEQKLEKLRNIGIIGSKRDDGSFCFHDDMYDGSKTDKSFVMISRCAHPLNGDLSCTVIGSYSNASIAEVAKHLVFPIDAKSLLGKFLSYNKLPYKFQALIKVNTNMDKGPSFAKRPECILFKEYQ